MKKKYRSRTKLRRAKVGNFIIGAKRIFVNENLTALRSRLFKKVRDKRKITTAGERGKIYVKTEPANNSAGQIKCETDLAKL